MTETWETAVRAAANTMLGYPDKISDGLEAELYALLEQLGTGTPGQPQSTGTPGDAALPPAVISTPPGGVVSGLSWPGSRRRRRRRAAVMRLGRATSAGRNG